jgi:Fe-S oxidoreductase
LELFGYDIVEMKNNKEDSSCCGAGAGLQNNHTKVSHNIAKERIKQAEDTSTKKLVTPCPMCYHQLKNHSKEVKILEFSEAIINGIK